MTIDMADLTEEFSDGPEDDMSFHDPAFVNNLSCSSPQSLHRKTRLSHQELRELQRVVAVYAWDSMTQSKTTDKQNIFGCDSCTAVVDVVDFEDHRQKL